MKIVGLDFSITSPSLCIFDMDTKKTKLIAWTQVKSRNIPVTKIKDFEFECRYIDRKDDFYFKLSDEISSEIPKQTIHMGIEDFAFSASGQLTNLAECVGVIKYHYYKKFGKHIQEIAIPQGKMCTNEANKANVGKYTGIEWFIKTKVPNLLEKTGLSIQDETPLSDWVDSYGICMFAYYTYLYSENTTETIPERIKASLDKKAK